MLRPRLLRCFGTVLLACWGLAACSEDAAGPTAQAQTPTILEVSPNPILGGAEEAELTIRGGGFGPTSTARWAGADRPTTLETPGELRVELREEDLRPSESLGRPVPVTVWNPASGKESRPETATVASLGKVSASVEADTFGAVGGVMVRVTRVKEARTSEGGSKVVVRTQATDESGTALFVGLPAGEYDVAPVASDTSVLYFDGASSDAESGAPAADRVRISLERTKAETHLNASIVRTSEIIGTVRNAESGEPIDGAAVHVEIDRLSHALQLERPWVDSTRTNADGSYVFGVPAGQARLSVEGGAAYPELFFGEVWDSEERSLAVSWGEAETADAELDVEAEPCIAGTIRFGQTVEGNLTGDDCVYGGETWELWRLEGGPGDFIDAAFDGGRDFTSLALVQDTAVRVADGGPPHHRVKRIAGRLSGAGEYFLKAGWARSPDPGYTLSLTRASEWTSLTAGARHACGLDPDGAAWCWGEGADGRLGDGRASSSTVPVAVSGGHSFQQISAGQSHTCGMTGAGEVLCWGDGSEGQLGAGSTASSIAPVGARSRSSFRSISVSATGAHACALDTGGAAWCWGRNRSGQLGDGSTTDRNAPVQVAGTTRYTSIAAGASHTCAVSTEGLPHCWGANDRGQLGDGTTDPHLRPRVVERGISVDVVAAGAEHTCVLDRDAETAFESTFCWGRNDMGQVRGGSPPDDQLVPVQADFSHWSYDIAPFGSLSAAAHRTCMKLGYYDNPDSAFCWGEGPAGMVDGWLEYASVVTGGAAGAVFTCGIGRDRLEGAAYCWGSNQFGQLGDGTREDRPHQPEAVAARP